MILYQKDRHKIVTLTFDMDKESVNIINHELAKALVPVLAHLEKEIAAGQVSGVILCSAKRSFMAGGDLDYLHGTQDAAKVYEYAEDLRRIFRRIEKLRVPVVAAINGAAMGSGYELCLTCHRRIALDQPKTLIGLPEVNLGMIPGGGSIARLTWMLGLVPAFEILSSGKRYHIKEALNKGLVDELVNSPEALIERARAFILSRPKLSKAWDEGDLPDASDPRHPKTAQAILRLTAETVHRTSGNYPAVQAILNVMVEGAMTDFDTARRIESRYFTAMVLSKECQNLTKAHWYDFNKIHNGLSRPKGVGRFRARKIGIVGAGQIGSGLAYTAALEGIEVVLRDISVAIAQQGKDVVKQKLEKLLHRGQLSKAQFDEVLARVKPTESFADFEHCDLVIESVFEHRELKSRVLREMSQYLPAEGFLASNTSTLSISELGQSLQAPQAYLGLHFFSPVSRSALVEIVPGQKTSPETLARAFDFVLQLGKTPIVVEDKPGFFVSRVVKAYLLEALSLLEEGCKPALLENIARQAGMPLGPLRLADNIGLLYFLQVEEMMQRDYQSPVPQGYALLKALVEGKRRHGKGKGGGFYEYPAQGPSLLWPGLNELLPPSQTFSPEDIRERLLFIQCLEMVRAWEEGSVKSGAEANLGSILGWGFPAFKGGGLQFINDYGIEAFVNRAEALAQSYGSRFQPCARLLEMRETGQNFS